MKFAVRVPLATEPAQLQQLHELQEEFTKACNSISPKVVSHRCWNRVTLHHLTYKQLREQFPRLGSQMACNAIYAVCRAARIVYQHPNSPFNLTALGARPLPRMQFTANSPVYFDRHTLSLRENQVSIFTLDGRIKLGVSIDPEVTRRFRQERVREIVLNSKGGEFGLSFVFDDQAAGAAAERSTTARTSDESIPEHVQVQLLHEPKAPHPGVNQPTFTQA